MFRRSSLNFGRSAFNVQKPPKGGFGHVAPKHSGVRSRPAGLVMRLGHTDDVVADDQCCQKVCCKSSLPFCHPLTENEIQIGALVAMSSSSYVSLSSCPKMRISLGTHVSISQYFCSPMYFQFPQCARAGGSKLMSLLNVHI